MPEKDPLTYALATYLWVILLSIIGGTVSFIRKVRLGIVRAFNITEFLGELVTSGFTGVITFWLCESAGIQPLITAALIGISGHMGGRVIFILEKFAERKYEKITGEKIDD